MHTPPVLEEPVQALAKNPQKGIAWWHWALLGAVVLGALLLRAHDLGRIFVWLDETDFFNENIYRTPPKPLIRFAIDTKNATTNTWGWPAVIWTTCAAFGRTIGVARAPSVFVGTAAVGLIFLLVYGLFPATAGRRRFWPAVFAAAVAAVAMPQMEFSQRTYPYTAVPCMAALLLLAHFRLVGQVSDVRPVQVRDLRYYTAIAAVALCIHVSLGLLIAVSLFFLSPTLFGERKRLWKHLCAMALILLFFCAINAKNPKYGFRPYLVRYYHPLSLHSIPKLLLHTYDFLTYHLNLFYNESLYWPERLNPILIPLIVVCLLGWGLAAAGRYGPPAKHLALLGAAATVLPAAMSFVKAFPFGGVRQTLFLSPFLLAFTGLGFYALFTARSLRLMAVVAAGAYLALWGLNLPRFYRERVLPYTAQDLVDVWEQNGKMQVYARGGNERELDYVLRGHQEIPFRSLPLGSKAPYLLIVTHYPIDDAVWFEGYPAYLKDSGYRAELVMERPMMHLSSREYSTSLYFPPNGIRIYKVTAR